MGFVIGIINSLLSPKGLKKFLFDKKTPGKTQSPPKGIEDLDKLHLAEILPYAKGIFIAMSMQFFISQNACLCFDSFSGLIFGTNR